MGERNPIEYEELTIIKIKHGGFVVRKPGYGCNMSVEVFACTDIGEALIFIRSQLVGESPVVQAAALDQISNLMGVNQATGANLTNLNARRP